jgi:3-hydroxyanthranilate 3,4-dioxygenase
VIERKRLSTEIDGVRWYVPQSTETLYEKWFHCKNLGIELAPIIKEYFASEEYQTKIPSANVYAKSSLPFELNNTLLLKNKHGSFRLEEKLNKNCLLTPAELNLQFKIEIFGQGQFHVEHFNNQNIDLWLWQLNGQSDLKLTSEHHEEYFLTENDSLLITENYCNNISIIVKSGFLMFVTQDPKLKTHTK